MLLTISVTIYANIFAYLKSKIPQNHKRSSGSNKYGYFTAENLEERLNAIRSEKMS